MTKVFLSYGREDRDSARKIADALESAGHCVWWDRHIKGGAQFSKEIDQELEAAEAIVVLWSESSIESPWVRDEATAGRDRGRLVPACIDKCNPPLGFRQYQTIDLARAGIGGDDGLDVLDEAVQSLAAGGAGPGNPARQASRRRRDGATRRRVLAGAGAVTLIAATGGAALLYRSWSRNEAPPEVQPLLLQAKQLMDQNTAAGQNQAIGLYRRAVEIAPGYADGWGWLGFAHAVVSHYRPRSEALAHKARAEAAGRRALELDPRSAYGELALSAALPFVGHWAERERRLIRALDIDPKSDQILLVMAVALQFAGRSTEAVPVCQRVGERPMTPASYNNYIRALWSAERLAELDQAISDAASLYPTQSSIWFTQVEIAMYSGQVGKVAALAEDVQSRPAGVSDDGARQIVALARAIQTRNPANVDSIMAEEKSASERSAREAEYAIRNMSALGRLDDAFTVADAYYFGRGFKVPDYRSDPTTSSPEQRQTRLLFEPVTKPMREDSRFELLVKDLGFDRYWRESGKPPDYRHIAGL